MGKCNKLYVLILIRSPIAGINSVGITLTTFAKNIHKYLSILSMTILKIFLEFRYHPTQWDNSFSYSKLICGKGLKRVIHEILASTSYSYVSFTIKYKLNHSFNIFFTQFYITSWICYYYLELSVYDHECIGWYTLILYMGLIYIVEI